MKEDHILLTIAAFVVFLLFSVGCKPKRLVAENALTERVVSHADSSAFWELKENLHAMEIQLAVLEGDLKSAREENINLRNESSGYVINYDTNTPVDSVTNRPAVQSEVFTIINSRYENSIRENETLHLESRKEIEMLTLQNSNLQLRVMSLHDENRELKEESSSRADFYNRFSIEWAVAGFVIILLTGQYFRRTLFK